MPTPSLHPDRLTTRLMWRNRMDGWASHGPTALLQGGALVGVARRALLREVGGQPDMAGTSDQATGGGAADNRRVCGNVRGGHSRLAFLGRVGAELVVDQVLDNLRLPAAERGGCALDQFVGSWRDGDFHRLLRDAGPGGLDAFDGHG